MHNAFPASVGEGYEEARFSSPRHDVASFLHVVMLPFVFWNKMRGPLVQAVHIATLPFSPLRALLSILT